MEETSQSNSGIWKAGMAIFAIAAAVLGYLLYDAKQFSQKQIAEINAKVAEITTVNVKLDSVGRQLDAKILEIQSLGGKVEELEEAKAQLMADKLGLKKVNSFSAKNYEGKISNYDVLLAAKDQEIAVLKRKNGILENENKNLNNQNQTLNSENSNLKTEKQGLADSVNNYSAKNRELTAKVNLASALKAQDVQVFAVASSGKLRDGGVYRASKVDKIKVSFMLASNPLTKQDNKTIYMRILDPEGAVLSDNSMGSGTFDLFGKEAVYSGKQNADYNNSNQLVDMMYSRGAVAYRAGRYSIELYSEGYKIGEGSFEIK
jgi:predicted nuclease with TOPRIM domain